MDSTQHCLECGLQKDGEVFQQQPCSTADPQLAARELVSNIASQAREGVFGPTNITSLAY